MQCNRPYKTQSQVEHAQQRISTVIDQVREKLTHLNKEQAEAILKADGVAAAVNKEVQALCPEWNGLWEVCVYVCVCV